MNNLAQSFSGFEQQIIKIKEQKKDNDEQTIIAIKQELQSIQSDLDTEARKRDQTVSAVESKYETEIQNTKKQIETPLYAKLDALIESVQHLSSKIDTISETHEKDRRDFHSCRVHNRNHVRRW